jgi:hypothetical protein
MTALAVVVAALLPVDAGAHKGNPNYESKLTAVDPAVEGLELQVLSRDDRLELRNDTGQRVLVYGYSGEPYARILADGSVQVNDRSPATYLNRERNGQVDVPESADKDAPPEWRELDGTGRFEWHDHRIHWMGEGRPDQVQDEDTRTKVFDWEVDLQVGTRPVAAQGTLFWTPTDDGGPPVAAIAALAAVALAGGALVVFVRRQRRASSVQAGTEDEAW